MVASQRIECYFPNMFDNASAAVSAPTATPVSRGSDPPSSVRPILLVCVAAFGLMTGQQMVNPILAPLARELGLSELALGVVMAVGASGVVFASGFWVRRAHARGHRAVLLTSLGGAAVGLAGFALVAQIGLSGSLPTWLVFVLVVLSRGLLFGIAWAATPATAQSYIAAATAGEVERVRGMASFGAAQGLGLAVGPALGGLLSIGGLLVPMYAAPVVLVLIAIVLAARLPRASAQPLGAAPKRVRVLDRRIWPFLLIGSGLYSAITIVLMTAGFLLQDRMHVPTDRTGVQTGLITLAGAALIVVVQAVVVRRLAWPPHRLIRVGCATMTAGMIVVAAAPTALWLALGVAMLGAGLGFGMPGVSAAPSLRATAAEQGSVASLVNATVAVAFALAPLIGNGLYEVGTAVPYLASAAALLALTGFAIGHRGIGPDSTQAAVNRPVDPRTHPRNPNLHREDRQQEGTLMRTTTTSHSAIIAMCLGLVLTAAVTAVPFLGSPRGELISRHIASGYPSYSASEVATATDTYLAGLVIVGVLGLICWAACIAAAWAGKRWAPWAALGGLIVGASIALFDLTIRDTSGDTGLPPLIGWLGLLPSPAGLVAVALLWTRRSDRSAVIEPVL